MFNILEEPLIRMRTREGSRIASLPEVYAGLTRYEIDAFPALRPHQRHAWHAFLVQLGVMAMREGGASEPPHTATEWDGLIRGLTPDYPDDEPWRLVVEDVTKPAFMQPPASSKEKEADYKNTVDTPDQLDMLVTSKNHDLKSAVSLQAEVDDWIFALITLQTMEGFSGAGNYGISRMNGGLGNRPALSLAPVGGVGAHVRRDIRALLAGYQSILNEYSMTEDGIRLLWLQSWDGAKSEKILPNRLNPLYLEICRRIRLRSESRRNLYAIRATSKSERIEAKSMKGLMGDPWTMVSRKDVKSLTLANGGFNYKRIAAYLTSADWEYPSLLRTAPFEESSEAEMLLVARGMVRGQGKTEGYHERVIPIRHRARTAMLGRRRDPELGEIANDRINQIGIVRRILSHAIQRFLTRGENKPASPEQRALAGPWLDRLDDIIDARFFEDLQIEFEASESDQDNIRRQWLMNGGDVVIDHARSLLSEAVETLPCPRIHRYRARVNAENLFEGRLRGNSGLPFLFDTEREGNRECINAKPEDTQKLIEI